MLFFEALTTVFKILQSRFRENWDPAFLAKEILHGSLGTKRSTNLFLMIVTVYATYCGYPQLTIICSNLTILTLEQGVKLFKINNIDIRTTPMTLFW